MALHMVLVTQMVAYYRALVTEPGHPGEEWKNIPEYDLIELLQHGEASLPLL